MKPNHFVLITKINVKINVLKIIGLLEFNEANNKLRTTWS